MSGARRVEPWALASSATAPVALVGGWMIAAALQPAGYDPVRQTISALAAAGAAHRAVMTAALLVVGTCHVVTAAGLRPLPTAPRLVLAVAGLAGIGVALAPQPAAGSSGTHVACAALSIGALAVWPLTVATARGRAAPGRAAGLTVTALLAVLAVWLVVELAGGPSVGLAERALTGAEAVWPLAVALALARAGSVRMSG